MLSERGFTEHTQAGEPVHTVMTQGRRHYSLLHAFHHLHTEGEHPQAEDELVLQLEGDAPVQDIKDAAAAGRGEGKERGEEGGRYLEE